MIIRFLQDVIKDTPHRKWCENTNMESVYSVSRMENEDEIEIRGGSSNNFIDDAGYLMISKSPESCTITSIFININTYDISLVSYIDENDDMIEKDVSGSDFIPDDQKDEYYRLCKEIVDSAMVYTFL